MGSSLALLFAADGFDVTCFDNLKRRGSELNLPRLKAAGIKFVHGDVRCAEDFDQIDEAMDVVIDASAEPSVLSGIGAGNPNYVINTNLVGTQNCLNFSLRNKSTFVFLSTSRVYPIGPLEEINYIEEATRFSISKEQTMHGISHQGVAETFPINGYRSFYGASKLASELLIQEYDKFYGLKCIVNRCGVIAGPWQMGKVDQGVMVLWLAKHFYKGSLSYIGYGGTGKQVRDALHIQDLFELVKLQLQNPELYRGEIFNVGGGLKSSTSLQELTKYCEDATGNKIQIANVPQNREADIRIYITDNAKITAANGWTPKHDVRDIVKDIFTWLKDNEQALKPFLS